MKKYTHFYTPYIEQNGIKGAVFPLDQFEEIMSENVKCRALGGMKVLQIDYESTVMQADTHDAWLRIDRGCSWLHTQKGYLCAGAGGVNSSPIRKLKEAAA